MAKANKPGRQFMVRAARKTSQPRMEYWLVQRFDPVTGEGTIFGIECEEGMFFTAYRLHGLSEGVVYDPYFDLDNGMQRMRVKVENG